MTRLRASAVETRLGERTVLHGVDLDVAPGEVLALVGPNGSGKTTLLRTCYRALSVSGGAILLDDTAVHTMRRRDVARTIGVSTQEPTVHGGVTVRESVRLGRSVQRGWLEPFRPEDDAVVRSVLARVALTDHADRDVAALSGGERQRVSIARALAQEPDVLLLDEPTNHLDLRHQLGVLGVLRELAADGLAVLVTLHDMRLAAEYCDRMAVLRDGSIVDVGVPEDVLTPELLGDVFGVRGELRAVDGRRVLDLIGLVDD
ncbi:MAG: ABC transporter ATP-binding protein [Rhodococcus sp.]|uniref:ABC transporter ATP-binding protein n=1 Tax=Rhodococcus TaxID=1827 RepID=UPI00169EDDBB|nr:MULTISPECIES: ABC transporter ATP-binding protein [Rhodococcus]NLV78109.1 ABC transporter ATP-binding protein [Rhodococcus sp. (in: high G+C Gram-positive bacteria)]